MSRVTTLSCDRCDADITEGVTLSATSVTVDKDGEHNYLGRDLPLNGVDLCARCWAVVLAKIVEEIRRCNMTTTIHQGFGEQLVTIARPFVLTSDGRVITSVLVDLDDSLRVNAQRLGCTVKMLCKLLDAEKAWRRARDDSEVTNG